MTDFVEEQKEEEKPKIRCALVNEKTEIVENVCVGENLETMPKIEGYFWREVGEKENCQINDFVDIETDEITDKHPDPLPDKETQPTKFQLVKNIFAFKRETS